MKINSPKILLANIIIKYRGLYQKIQYIFDIKNS